VEGKQYTIEAAASILGVSEDRINDLIAQQLVECEEVEGVVMIPEREVKILFNNIDDYPSSTNVSVPKEKDKKRADKIKGTDGVIVVEEQELIELYEELEKHADRVKYLMARGKRIEEKIKSHKKQALGHDAEFRDLAVAYHPNLTGKYFEPERTDDGVLILKQHDGGTSSEREFNNMMNKIISEGLRRGYIPPGSIIGPFHGPPPPGDDDDEPVF